LCYINVPFVALLTLQTKIEPAVGLLVQMDRATSPTRIKSDDVEISESPAASSSSSWQSAISNLSNLESLNEPEPLSTTVQQEDSDSERVNSEVSLTTGPGAATSNLRLPLRAPPVSNSNQKKTARNSPGFLTLNHDPNLDFGTVPQYNLPCPAQVLPQMMIHLNLNLGLIPLAGYAVTHMHGFCQDSSECVDPHCSNFQYNSFFRDHQFININEIDPFCPIHGHLVRETESDYQCHQCTEQQQNSDLNQNRPTLPNNINLDNIAYEGAELSFDPETGSPRITAVFEGPPEIGPDGISRPSLVHRDIGMSSTDRDGNPITLYPFKNNEGGSSTVWVWRTLSGYCPDNDINSHDAHHTESHESNTELPELISNNSPPGPSDENSTRLDINHDINNDVNLYFPLGPNDRPEEHLDFVGDSSGSGESQGPILHGPSPYWNEYTTNTNVVVYLIKRYFVPETRIFPGSPSRNHMLKIVRKALNGPGRYSGGSIETAVINLTMLASRDHYMTGTFISVGRDVEDDSYS